MTPHEMNQLLREHIPLCQFMGLEVTELSPQSIHTRAPLGPNLNMHGTGFAGSLYALAVATGWALSHNKMESAAIRGQLVVKTATMHYRRPVTADIELTACFTDETLALDITETFKQENKLSFPLKIMVLSNGKKCGYLEAEYIALAH